MKEHNMKRTVVLLAIMLLSFGLTNAANRVDVYHSPDDTLWTGEASTIEIWIENDNKLGGISLGFAVSATGVGTYTLDNVASTFAPATPNGGTFITGVGGSRWMSGANADGSCWDLGGTLINDNLAPAQFLLGGAALSAGLNAGASEHMLNVHLTTGGVTGDPAVPGNTETLCIDSLFYPPAGEFIFDPGGTPASNLPVCFVIAEKQDVCPVWDGGLPTAMSVDHCGSGQVTVSATDPEGGTVYYYVNSNGGAGTATVGNTSGVVTYTPDPADVGNTFDVCIEATDAVHQEGGCTGDLWCISVTVTNNAPSIDCNATNPKPVGQGNTLNHTVTGTDPDGCDVLQYFIPAASTLPAEPVGSYGLVGDEFFFNTNNPGDGGILYTFTICVTDGFDTACCQLQVDVLTLEPWMVGIEKVHEVLQGHFVDVPVRLKKGSEPFGGFDFLIGYDASALAFTEATLAQFWVDCGWEYFTYRYNWNGNCGNACPSGLVRVVGMAETNNGPNHPDYECMAQWEVGVDCYEGGEILFYLTFYVSNDRTLECQFAPVRFYWFDCGDNTMSTVGGDTLAINRFIYDIGSCTYQEMQDYEFGFPGYYGAPDFCLEGDKVEPIRFLDLCNGGVDIICADSIDARGDINVNGVVYEIADAVMLTNYFISGLSAFGTHVEASIAASDVNADGIALSVADLVYLTRVIVGDANPYPKPIPNASATVVQHGAEVRLDASVDVGGVLLTFNANNTVVPQLGVDMDMKYGQVGNELRVLIYDIGTRGIDAGETILVTVPGAELTGAEVASYDGFTVPSSIQRMPVAYSLNQNTPNPFNPSTRIAFNMPVEADWTIEVFNIAGQLVRDFSGHSQAGTVEVTWNGTDKDNNPVASGIYFYRARTNDFSETKKMLLMK
jgi:hypothetical protein